jgi:uncharacterized protein (DUF1810 family)
MRKRNFYDQVLQELRESQKRSHWMWFIFPQIAGLGYSAMSRRFAIYGVEEAKAYLHHSLLRARLTECVELVCTNKRASIVEILGSPDNMKFRSSMTLFDFASVERKNPFNAALEIFFGGERDQATLKILSG